MRDAWAAGDVETRGAWLAWRHAAERSDAELLAPARRAADA